MTLAERRTALSLPLRDTDNMFPQRAARVIAIMRMDHSSSLFVVKPSSSLNSAGARSKNRALSPKTVAPLANTLRRYR